MRASISALLDCLPPYRDQWLTVSRSQSVRDIITEMLEAHKEFAPYYDSFSHYFDGDSTEEICKNIYDFLKQNVNYKEEAEEDQTTALPTGILIRRKGDCKHYASFAGGVLDSLNRTEARQIDWCYRFASYDIFNRVPHHVFIVVKDEDRGGEEIWIDPTPGASSQIPVWQIDKKVKVSTMALRRNISGIGVASELVYVDSFPTGSNQVLSPSSIVTVEEQEADKEVTPELQNAIEVLLHYGVMNEKGEINDSLMDRLVPTLPPDQFEELSTARQVLSVYIAKGMTLGSIFSDIWRGVKKVTLAVPRNAYLSLVALNAFGMATKLYNAVFNLNGSYWQPGQDRLYKFWHSAGGDWNNLENAIKSGEKKKAILGCVDCTPEASAVGVVPALPGWVAVASALIAAIRPLIQDILKARYQANQMNPGVDYNTGLPKGTNPGAYPGGSFDIIEWVKANPLESLAIAAGLYYFLQPTKKTR